MNDLHELGVAGLAAAIAGKKTSSVEAAQHLLARAKCDADAVRDDLRDYVLDAFADPGVAGAVYPVF